MENSKKVLLETNGINNSENEDDERSHSESKEQKSIPLAAKDSEWADTTYHKPKRRIKLTDNNDDVEEEEEEEEEEMFLVNPPDEIEIENLPIYALFPSLRDHYPESSSFLNREISTTDIAKFLVGEKPNFSVLKTSAKLLPSKIMLESIQEIPLDSSDEEETNLEDFKIMADSSTKEIGDASKKGIEDQCSVSVHRNSKRAIAQRTFPCTYPPAVNQMRGKSETKDKTKENQYK